MYKLKEIPSNKGITLIALIITIIVLLILAGVSIAMLTGENGLIAKAATSKAKTEKAELEEKEKLAKTNEIMDRYVTNREGTTITITEQQLNEKIVAAVKEANKEELLWENPNKSAQFAVQTVSWSSTEYNRVDVIYKNYISDSDNVNNQTATLYPGRASTLIFNYKTSDMFFARRTATFSSSKNSVAFTEGNVNGTTNNNHIIPLYIIGHKSDVNI